jgi:hypothetical protein
MRKIGYLLIGILVIGGFGILGYVAGQSFKQSTMDGNEASGETVQKTISIVSHDNGIKINS